jgi:branched-chain amino acid transport system substrate-binding protein
VSGTPRNGRPIWTTRRTWPSSRRSRRNTGASRRSTPAKGFDTANLILSALEAGHPSDSPDAFREALRAADFASTRGDFAFGPNHHPIQDIYVREVVQVGDIFTNRIVGVALEDRGDAFAADCSM